MKPLFYFMTGFIIVVYIFFCIYKKIYLICFVCLSIVLYPQNKLCAVYMWYNIIIIFVTSTITGQLFNETRTTDFLQYFFKLGRRKYEHKRYMYLRLRTGLAYRCYDIMQTNLFSLNWINLPPRSSQRHGDITTVPRCLIRLECLFCELFCCGKYDISSVSIYFYVLQLF